VNEAQGVVLLDVVAEIGGPQAMALLEDTYRNADKPAWERWAALGLARNFREVIADTMFDWLQGADRARRQTAALALGYIGGDGAELALIHAMHDPQIAPQAVRALQRRESVTGLAEGYAADDADVWIAITNALLDLGDEGTLPLIDIVQNEHPDFYDKVMVSLQNLDRPEAAEVINAADYDADGNLKTD